MPPRTFRIHVRLSKVVALLQFQDLDIPVPDLLAVVLESNKSRSSKISYGSRLPFQCELVSFSVWAQTELVEIVAVHFGHHFVVDFDADFWAFAFDHYPVPFAKRFAGVFRCADQVVYGTELMFARLGPTHYLNFKTGVDRITRVFDSEENP